MNYYVNLNLFENMKVEFLVDRQFLIKATKINNYLKLINCFYDKIVVLRYIVLK